MAVVVILKLELLGFEKQLRIKKAPIGAFFVYRVD